jgi:UDP-3-O-acyl N-acetylglucosamine deacetylase
MRPQQTICRPVSVSGKGYWSGRTVTVDFLPAPAGAGIAFVRAGSDVPVRIPATVDHRVEATARTNLASSGVQVQMVEHAMSALAGLGIDCCLVRVDAEEMPGLDGSSQAFVDALDAAGSESLGAAVEPLVVEEVCRVGDDDAWVEVSPPRFAGLSVEYELDYGPGPIGRQTLSVHVTPEAYRTELASARTFISQDDAARLREAGLAVTVGYGDLLVFGADGPVGNSLRWPDECVRHKVLDLVGDLALVGRPLHAHVRARRSGHRLNGAMAARLVAGLGRRASA